jgi:hypothetical protein
LQRLALRGDGVVLLGLLVGGDAAVGDDVHVAHEILAPRSARGAGTGVGDQVEVRAVARLQTHTEQVVAFEVCCLGVLGIVAAM